MSAETLSANDLPTTATAKDAASSSPAADVEAAAPPAVSRLKRLWTFGSTVGVAFGIVGLQMAQGILLARLLGPEGRGQYATAVLYVQILLYIGLFGGVEVICRYAADGADLTRLRRSALWLGITTGVVTTASVMVLNWIALPADKRFLMPSGLLCGLSLIGQHVMLIMTAVDRGAGRFSAYNWRRLIAAAAFPALLIIAALIVPMTLTLACSLFVVASILSMLACVIGLKQPFTGDKAVGVRPLLWESKSYGVSMLATDLFERLDLLLVMWLAPLVTQGFYAAMVPVVYPLTVIPNTLGIFLFNAGADSGRRLKRSDIHRILAGSIAVQTATTVAFWIVVGPVVQFVYGDAFEPAIAFAYWLAPVSAIKGILQGLDSYVKGRGKPLASIRCRVVAMVIMILVTAATWSSLGAYSIALSALTGQVVCLIWLSAIVYADVES
ncbi:MAG: oligosaccharide flippase family protein [Planctomycetota bacterium]